MKVKNGLLQRGHYDIILPISLMHNALVICCWDIMTVIIMHDTERTNKTEIQLKNLHCLNHVKSTDTIVFLITMTKKGGKCRILRHR